MSYNLDQFEFIVIYPPEGDSTILEVSTKSLGDFLHVFLDAKGELIFKFLNVKGVELTERQLGEITEVAKTKVTLASRSQSDG